MTLQGKVAIVTGGNTGIGQAVVLALAEQGATIVIDYIANEEAEHQVEQQVRDLGDQVVGVKADVSQVADLTTLVGTAVSTFGRLDIMVNNAGIETRTSVLDTTEEQYGKVLDINLKSAFFGTQLAAKQMIAQGRRRPDHQHDLGPRGLAHARQHRLLPVQGRDAHARPGRPGWSWPPTTSWWSGSDPVPSTPPSTRPRWPIRALAKLDAAIPIGRLAEPEEIASVVAFLAGDGASYITATTIFADGGIMQSSPGL